MARRQVTDKMPFLEHLGELRHRIMWSLVAVLVGLGISLPFVERLMKLIRSGRIAMSMAWGSMHTDFMGGEELNRLAYDFTKLKNSYNITSELAMMNDVPVAADSTRM